MSDENQIGLPPSPPTAPAAPTVPPAVTPVQSAPQQAESAQEEGKAPTKRRRKPKTDPNLPSIGDVVYIRTVNQYPIYGHTVKVRFSQDNPRKVAVDEWILKQIKAGVLTHQ